MKINRTYKIIFSVISVIFLVLLIVAIGNDRGSSDYSDYLFLVDTGEPRPLSMDEYPTPADNSEEIRNMQRRLDIKEIAGAVQDYMTDTGSSIDDIVFNATGNWSSPLNELPSCSQPLEIGEVKDQMLDLEEVLAYKYIKEIPSDYYANFYGSGSGYFICKEKDNTITIFAPFAEEEQINLNF